MSYTIYYYPDEYCKTSAGEADDSVYQQDYDTSASLYPQLYYSPYRDQIGWSTSKYTSTPDYEFNQEVTKLNLKLYPCWKLSTVKIYIHPGDYSSGSSYLLAEPDVYTDVTLPGAIFSRTNYQQTGWTKNSNGTTKYYDLNASEKFQYEISQDVGELYLYPFWEATSYTITYNANGGSVSPSTQTVTVGSSTTTPTATRNSTITSKTINFYSNGGSTTKESQTVSETTTYTSNGWYTATSGGTRRASNGGAYTPSSSETLYAQWSSSSSGYGDITFPTASECSRANYTLLGFSTSSTASVAQYAPGVTMSVTSTTNTSWYAVWKKNTTYTIQFNANGGSGSVPATITKTGEAASEVVMGDISSTIPSRSGYTFRGWSSTSSYNQNYRIAYSSGYGGSADLNGTTAKTTSASWTYQDYCDKTGASSTTSTLTLYAQWENTTYTITYNANGGNSTPSSQSVAIGSSVSLASAISRSSTQSDGYTVSFYNSYTDSTETKTQKNTTTYTFKEWNTNSSGTGTSYAAGASMTPSTSGSITLYAIWTSSTTKGSLTAPTISSYSATSTKEAKVYRNDGSGDYSTLESQAASSYSPLGWYTANSGGSKQVNSGSSFVPSSSTTLYAQWSETAGSYPNVTLPTSWTRDSWTLLGFSTSSTATSATYNSGTSVSPNNTYYAIWKRTLTLTLRANNSTYNSDSRTIYNTTTSGAFTITSNKPTQTGYTFASWNTKEDGTGTAYAAGGTISISTDTTLYAQWTVNSYNLTVKALYSYYDDDGEEYFIEDDTKGSIELTIGDKTYADTSLSLSVAYNTTVVAKAASVTGYSFIKWNDNTTTRTKEFLMPAETKELVAYFGDNNYGLTIVANGDTDVAVWMMKMKEEESGDIVSDGDWVKMEYGTHNLDKKRYVQFVFQDGEDYEYVNNVVEQSGTATNNLLEYTPYEISDTTTLTITSKKIEEVNNIYIGNTQKTSGYINNPKVSFTENIKSIWVGDKQVLGKKPSRGYHYLYDTILGETLYIGLYEDGTTTTKTTIPIYAYMSSEKNLKSVIMSDNIQQIGNYAFSGCGLEYIQLSSKLKTIENGAFYDCQSSTDYKNNCRSIYLPNSVESITNPQFSTFQSRSLEQIRVGSNNKYYSSQDLSLIHI